MPVQHSRRMQRLAAPCRNQNGVTFLMAMFIISIMGIMLGMTGTSWKMIMQREREKELLFRGSQIKEAIENWYNPAYGANGVKSPARKPLTDLKDLLNNPSTLTILRYLPHHYETKLDTKNPSCSSDCPDYKIYQDPMSGKTWDIIKCDATTLNSEICRELGPLSLNAIIGVASKSEAKPYRTEFADTALENIANTGLGAATGSTITTINVGGSLPPLSDPGANPAGNPGGRKPTKYSEWKFIADKKNDHTKIYRAYHEGW